MPDYYDMAQNVFNRMAKAHKRGTGCRLSAEEIQALSITSLGEFWDEPDPRNQQELERAA